MVALKGLESSIARFIGVGALRRGVGPHNADGPGAYRPCHDAEIEGRVNDLVTFACTRNEAFDYLEAIRTVSFPKGSIFKRSFNALFEPKEVKRYCKALIRALRDLGRAPNEGRLNVDGYKPSQEIIKILAVVGRIAGLREAIKTKELPMWMRATAAKEYILCDFQKSEPLNPKEIKLVLDFGQDPDLAEVFREGSRYILFGPSGQPSEA